ncbi:MAG: hypothetical protein HY064_05875 [Bacteroidetes bacterium]|nr:hypothetical protein [Bacteroidota bacterium]
MPGISPIVTGTISTDFCHKKPGKFSGDMMDLLHKILPRDSDLVGETYYEPDSGNTKIWDISDDTNETYLVQTEAGYAGGSCGYTLVAVRANEDGNVQQLYEDCGAIDSVLNISHNGIRDFMVWYSAWYSDVPHYFRYNGKEFVEYSNPSPADPEEEIRKVITKSDTASLLPYDHINFQYVNFGDTLFTYILAEDMLDKKYLLKEINSRHYQLVGDFEADFYPDVLEHKTKGMNDLRFQNSGCVYTFYRWNGKQYVLWKKVSICAGVPST